MLFIFLQSSMGLALPSSSVPESPKMTLNDRFDVIFIEIWARHVLNYNFALDVCVVCYVILQGCMNRKYFIRRPDSLLLSIETTWTNNLINILFSCVYFLLFIARKCIGGILIHLIISSLNLKRRNV